MDINSLMRTKSKTLNYHQKVSYKTKPTKIINKNYDNLVIETDVCEIYKKNDPYLKYYKIIKPFYEKRQKGMYLIESKKDRKRYIIKVKSDLINNEYENVVVNILKDISNPNIIGFIKKYQTDNYRCYIYEYIDGDSLSDHARKENMTENEILDIFKQILLGVKCLHQHNILHCDLKLDNIMYEKSTGRVVIIDFDLARYSKDEFVTDNIFGTVQYIAPESYDLGIYSKKSDIWSLGIILFFMLTNQFPYESDSSIDNTYSNLYRRNHFKYPDFSCVNEAVINKNFSCKIPYLISKMLIFEDDKRSSIDELINIEI